MVGKGCSCGTLNYPEGNICLYMYKTFFKKGHTIHMHYFQVQFFCFFNANND